MLILWTPEKTDESVNPLQQMLAELLKLSLMKWNTVTISSSQDALPQFPTPVDAITFPLFGGLLYKYFQTHSGSLQKRLFTKMNTDEACKEINHSIPGAGFE